MTLAEIIRAQLATGRPLRVTRALLEALDAETPDVCREESIDALDAALREHPSMHDIREAEERGARWAITRIRLHGIESRIGASAHDEVEMNVTRICAEARKAGSDE